MATSEAVAIQNLLQAKKRSLQQANNFATELDEGAEKKFKSTNTLSDVEIDNQANQLVKEQEQQEAAANSEENNEQIITINELRQLVVDNSNYKPYVLPKLAHNMFKITIAELEAEMSAEVIQELMTKNQTISKHLNKSTYGIDVYRRLYEWLTILYFEKCETIENEYVKELYKYILEALCCTLLSHQQQGSAVLNTFNKMTNSTYTRKSMTALEARKQMQLLAGVKQVEVEDDSAEFEHYFGVHAGFAFEYLKPYFNLGSYLRNMSSIYETSIRRVEADRMLTKSKAHVPAMKVTFSQPFIVRIEKQIVQQNFTYYNMSNEDSKVLSDLLEQNLKGPRFIEYRDKFSVGSRTNAQMWCMLEMSKGTATTYTPKFEPGSNVKEGDESRSYVILQSLLLAPSETGPFVKTKLYPLKLSIGKEEAYYIDFDCTEQNEFRNVL